jgi:hypothetical protein
MCVLVPYILTEYCCYQRGDDTRENRQETEKGIIRILREELSQNFTPEYQNNKELSIKKLSLPAGVRFRMLKDLDIAGSSLL